jgi:hypothetical protein
MKKPFFPVMAMIMAMLGMLVFLSAATIPSDTAKKVVADAQNWFDKTRYENSLQDTSKYYTGFQINEQIKRLSERVDFIDFYSHFIPDRELVKATLAYCLKYNAPINSAFALCKGESRFNKNAFNRNENGTVDRSYWQLNNGHRRNWKVADYYNVWKSTPEAIRQFRDSINFANDITFAWLTYNMGQGGAAPWVVIKQIPDFRKNYIYEISEFEDMLNKQFNDGLKRWD